jgi:predicted Rdx family selenoprotein
MEDMPLKKLEPRTDSSSTDASRRLFDDACCHLKPGIKFVQEHPAESITAGLVLCSAGAVAVALRGRGLAALGTAGEGALGKNVLGNFLCGKSALGERLLGGVAKQLNSAALKPGAELAQYRTVAEEVAAFSRNLDGNFPEHDALAHVMTLKNPATIGGELRGAISESVAVQMIERPWWRKPSFRVALSAYERELRDLNSNYDFQHTIPEATLKKWFDLSRTRMAENIKRWGGVPKGTYYNNLQHLEVPRKWS